MKNKKIIFMGTPEFAASMLKALIKNNYNVIAVITQPDKPFGRKQELKFSEVKVVALENNIEVIQPISIKKDFSRIQELQADLIITAAYGQIVPQEVLDAPKILCINVHGSLLPKYRGGAPVHYAILNGDTKTGVTIMEMVQKMDAGGIITQREFPIEFEDTTGDVFEKMKKVGAELLIDTLPSILKEEFTITQQDNDLVTFSPTISKEDEYIDFNDTTINVYNKIRALNPFPVGYFLYNDKRYKVYSATIKEKSSVVGMIMNISKEGIEIGCIDGVICLTEIQPSGKKRIKVSDYINGKNEFEINKICQ